ncbi:hypothetical protein [Nocardioides sp. W7]|uniref:hypothetical protein n=1 Tax=Nocardioides sp. W7 TaxID=2931390 RepID=UPI001FD56501|nr:hypothetical protein [Nocardioides sp. W7]
MREELKELRDFYSCPSIATLRRLYPTKYVDPDVEAFLAVVQHDEFVHSLTIETEQVYRMRDETRAARAKKAKAHQDFTSADLLRVIVDCSTTSG